MTHDFIEFMKFINPILYLVAIFITGFMAGFAITLIAAMKYIKDKKLTDARCNG